jgi:multicomponent Na+:H+ antiporter subunit C
MHTVLAIVIGGLFAAAVYLMLRRSLAKLIIGLSLLTTATNLLILTVGGLTRARPPLVPVGAMRPVEPYADPIPQALILTAIVIGFGVLAFMMALAYRTYNVVGLDDLDDMVATDTLAPPRPDRAAAARAPWAEPEVTPQAEEVVIGRDQR